jgi:GH24 family phage-related lysozyme (muramidase)
MQGFANQSVIPNNQQSLIMNYPQYGTDFWGTSPDNNHGFGTSNITDNIANMNNLQNGMNNLQNGMNSLQNGNYISDDELMQRTYNNIKKFEDIVPHPYLDTKGNITVGGGANINNYNDFMKVNFLQGGKPATEEQKRIGFDQLSNIRQQANGKWNRTAPTYATATNLSISDKEAYRMAQEHLTNDLAHLRSEFKDFDSKAIPLKEVLMDLQYNTGSLNRRNWPKLYQAIDDQDIEAIAQNVHRKDVGQERNDWAEKMIRSIGSR